MPLRTIKNDNCDRISKYRSRRIVCEVRLNMFCCLRSCLNGNIRKTSANSHRAREPEIHLDANNMGPDVILLSQNLRITGTGGALATAPLVQSKSYFELKIQQSGCWSIGLATRQADLSKKFGGGDKESWCLCSDNTTRHNNEEFRPVALVTTHEPLAATADSRNALLNGNGTDLIGIDDVPAKGDSATAFTANGVGLAGVAREQNDFPDEGDIVGVAFDHVELNFYFNGKNLEVPYRNVRGAVFPVVYVGNGATLDVLLDNFNYAPPPGFDRIMLEQSLL